MSDEKQKLIPEVKVVIEDDEVDVPLRRGLGGVISRNAVLIGLVIQFLAWLYTSGSQNARVTTSIDYLTQRVMRLESQMDSINHITRGVPDGVEIPLPRPRP